MAVRSKVQAKYLVMALTTFEIILLKHLLQIRFGKDERMELVWDNQVTLHIASNLVHHKRTKHIKVDYQFTKEKIASECKTASFLNSSDQFAYIFT